jgi:hypothetical protein
MIRDWGDRKYCIKQRGWVYSSDENVHRFSHPLVIPGGTFTTFAFKAIFQPGSTRGVFTITAQIISGSGGETQLSNGSDSEKLDFSANKE